MVMILTFVSPSIGDGVVSSHHQLPHHAISAHHHDAHASEAHQSHAHDEGEADNLPTQDAHSSIGHLLSHMPASLFEVPQLTATPLGSSTIAFLADPIPNIKVAPLLRPPKPALS